MYKKVIIVIRKILLIVTSIFLIVWFGGAYYTKNSLVRAINQMQNDNVKISYEEASISGFPSKWQIRLKHPKITLIDQVSSNEIILDSVYVSTNFSLKEIKVVAGKKFAIQKHFEDRKSLYQCEAQNDIIFLMKTTQALPKLQLNYASLKTNFEYLVFDLPKLVVSDSDHLIFELSDIKFGITKDTEPLLEKFSLKLALKYLSDGHFMEFKNSNIYANLSYTINASDENKEIEFDRLINVEKVTLALDDAWLNLNGSMKLSTVAVPQGNFEIEMRKYSKMIDLLVPDDFILSRPYIKKVIAKSVMQYADNDSLMDKVRLSISFSDQGVKIGKLDLSDLKK